jgi:hypothetical protein
MHDVAIFLLGVVIGAAGVTLTLCGLYVATQPRGNFEELRQ